MRACLALATVTYGHCLPHVRGYKGERNIAPASRFSSPHGDAGGPDLDSDGRVLGMLAAPCENGAPPNCPKMFAFAVEAKVIAEPRAKGPGVSVDTTVASTAFSSARPARKSQGN